jgi:ubiquinone/menaquinone biosynthesis C-methylase UbiE/glutathione S-transferase
MATSARLRLYQYALSPYCIPIELLLKHSGIAHEVVDLPYGDPSEVIRLTKAEYYQVPVLEDLFSHAVVFDRGGDEVPRFIANLAPLLRLFPEEVAGWQQILVRYIENDCEAIGFKVNDAFCDKWLKNDLERGLHRRHKERKFGAGCLEDWARNVNGLIKEFHDLIYPFEQMLGRHSFLTGERPVFADYALCGVLGNFLFSGMTALPENCLMLEAWYTKMRAGNFRHEMDEMQLGAQDDAAAGSAHGLVAADVADLEKAVAELKLRAGTHALDVGTGHGSVALTLAAKGFVVTASDTSVERLQQAAQSAQERKLSVAFHEHGAEQFPYESGSFGLVTCHMAAHHFTAPESFIREATRVLKTYGYLVLIDDTVPDDQVEAHAWMNSVERLRDASHVRFVTPNVWRKWCVDAGLTVTKLEVKTLKQADLNLYFNETQTSPENRKKILEMMAKAPASVRELFKIGQEDGKIVWFRRRVLLVAGKV